MNKVGVLAVKNVPVRVP